MVKQLSTARNTQRFTELCRIEKGEGYRDDQEEKRESQKGGEQSSQ